MTISWLVNLSFLVDVETLCNDHVETMTEGEEEVHGLDRDGAKEPLGSLQARIHFAVASSAHLLPMELLTLTSNRTVTLPEHCTRQKKINLFIN